MKALQTLLPLVLFPSLFLAEITQLQAGYVYEEVEQDQVFSFDRAAWRKNDGLLVLRGTGTPGSKVDAFVAGTYIYLGSKIVNKRGYWYFKFYNMASAPCGVRAVSGKVVQEKAVSRAPAGCISSPEEPTPPENTAPVISGTPQTQVAEGQEYRFTPSANDADGDSLTFSINRTPSWATFNRSTGTLSGRPGYNDSGTISDIRISVSDGTDVASLNAFSITVSDTNRAPSISGSPATSVAEGNDYSFTPTASDPDGDSLTFSINRTPSWATFNRSTGTLSGRPGFNDSGTISDLRISVSDGNDVASLNAFSITVSNTNRAPSISGSPATSVDEGNNYSFTPTASDPDGDSLTFSINHTPSWATFDPSTGTLSGRPDYNDSGTISDLRISVSDGTNVASLNAFSITVADSLTEGGTFKFAQASYSVDEGDSVTVTITRDNGIGEATVNYGTRGVEARHLQDYNGFPSTAMVFRDGQKSRTITINTLSDDISESDETLGVYLESPSNGYTLASPSRSTITIHDVPPPNSEPSISGTPDQSVIAGDEYYFAASASDSDNDELTFSINNIPTWASFNRQTGVLSGIPGTEDIGSYGNIVISVTDGTATTSMSPFTINVLEPEATTGSVALEWIPPSTRTDGSTLDMSEIEGYKIYMGTTNDNLQQIMDLADNSITEYVVDNLDSGDYYFAVTTYDTEGNESSYSNIARKSTM
jgi:hypothetical protein